MNSLSSHFSAAAALLLAVTVCAGCQQRIGDFTLLTTKNINIDESRELKRLPHRVQGKDSSYFLFGLIPLTIRNMEEATDRAIESVPGAVALEDAVVISGFWVVPPFFGEDYYIVEGTPVVDPARTPESRFGVVPSREKW